MTPNPPDEVLRSLLTSTRTIALVGASPKANRPSHGVMGYLLDAGFDVTPVRPGGATVHGRPCVASLSELAEAPDLVDVFRASEHVPAIVEEALALGVKAIWLQDGVVHEEAAQRARDAGVLVVQNDCTLRVHRRLCS